MTMHSTSDFDDLAASLARNFQRIRQQTERNTTSKVPLLGDVPLLGYLFRTNSRTNDKTELLVFITPRIVAERLSTK